MIRQQTAVCILRLDRGLAAGVLLVSDDGRRQQSRFIGDRYAVTGKGEQHHQPAKQR